MDSSVSPEDEIWFLRVCHHISTDLYQEYFLRSKGGRCVELTSLPSSCADCLEIWKPQTPGTLRSCPGPQRNCVTTSIHQPTNAHIISHKTLLKHFKTPRHVSILSDHHQGALFLVKVTLRYSHFNSYLQTRCCSSISCCVVEQRLSVRLTTHT